MFVFIFTTLDSRKLQLKFLIYKQDGILYEFNTKHCLCRGQSKQTDEMLSAKFWTGPVYMKNGSNLNTVLVSIYGARKKEKRKTNLRPCLIAERRRVTRCQLNEERAVFFTSSAFPIYISDSSNLSRRKRPPFNLNNLIGVRSGGNRGSEGYRVAARCERASRHMFSRKQAPFKRSWQQVHWVGVGACAAASNCPKYTFGFCIKTWKKKSNHFIGNQPQWRENVVPHWVQVSGVCCDWFRKWQRSFVSRYVAFRKFVLWFSASSHWSSSSLMRLITLDLLDHQQQSLRAAIFPPRLGGQQAGEGHQPSPVLKLQVQQGCRSACQDDKRLTHWKRLKIVFFEKQFTQKQKNLRTYFEIRVLKFSPHSNDGKMSSIFKALSTSLHLPSNDRVCQQQKTTEAYLFF